MSGAENFIRWYADRIATIDMVDARNKLFNIRAKNPKMYEFLVSEFKGDSPKPRYQPEPEENDEYDFAKDRVRYKKPVRPSTIMTRMEFESSVPRQSNIPIATTNMAASTNIPDSRCITTTNMAAFSNIPMYTQMSTSSNIPETKMLSAMDYGPNIPRRKPLPDDGYKYSADDDLQYLEELAKERRLNKQGIYTKMASRRNIPDETQTFMARESNIPPSLNKNQMRFLRGEDYEK
jgi:hypothetical protein